MNLRQYRSEEPDVSLTPLIDVVFLLLIFFMVSTNFTRESEITVDLPEAAMTETDSDEHPIELGIDADGRYFINGKLLVNTQRVTLIKALKPLAGDHADKPSLIISADARTPHQAVITAMDAARQLSIVHLSIATKERADKHR